MKEKFKMTGRKKALIVDDEEDFLLVLKKRVIDAGFDVITAENGNEALDKIKHENPDIILLDIMMPDMGGLDVLRNIREYDKNIPVFIMTAFQNEKRFMIANELNASGFIIKGSDIGAEIEKMKEIIGISE